MNRLNKLIARYNYLIKLFAGIFIMVICIKVTVYLFRDIIRVHDDAAELIGGIIFGVILSGVIANILEALTSFKRLKAKNLENYSSAEDGDICLMSGVLESIGPPLISPFTRTPCVAYKYEITHTPGNSDLPATLLDATGGAMTPSVIQGDNRQINICGHAEFEGFDYPEIPIDNDADLQSNVKRYLSETTFKPMPVSDIMNEIKTYYQDTEGEYRFDVKGNLEDVTDKQFNEMCIPTGVMVSGIGEYSQFLEGLIKGKKGRLTLIAGDMNNAMNHLHAKARSRLGLGVLLLVIYCVVLGTMYLVTS